MLELSYNELIQLAILLFKEAATETYKNDTSSYRPTIARVADRVDREIVRMNLERGSR
jgi:hypothetical protein